MKIENRVVSGVISSTLSESEESERFHFLPIPLMTPTLQSPSQQFLGSSRNVCGEERCVTSLKTAAKETTDAYDPVKTRLSESQAEAGE